MTQQANFKFHFPVQKAEERDDGLYLIGLASGPEVDLQRHRMHPNAISDFARQIEDRFESGNPVPYRDIHMRDGVLSHLGDVVKGWIDDKFNLGVEVKLDEDNPSARYLHKSIKNKGKKFGMSIRGDVPMPGGFKDEVVDSGPVRTFYKVELEEISNTTLPIYQQSLGTVLTKAIDTAQQEAEVEASEDEHMGKQNSSEALQEALASGQTAQNVTGNTAATVEADGGEAVIAAPEVVTESTVEEVAAEAREDRGEAEPETTEKSQASTPDPEQIAKAVAAAVLTALGISKSQSDAKSADSTDSGETVVKSEDDTRYAALEKSLNDTRAELDRIKELVPAGTKPDVLEGKEEIDIKKAFNEVSDPMERLRLALAVKHGEGTTTR